MDRRRFLSQIPLAAAGAAVAADDATPVPDFSFAELGVAELAPRLADGSLKAVTLAQAYLDRIAAIDAAGPALRSVIELNPDALDIARALDQERAAKGPRGPLHGVPVLIKDNIATADRMATTAGSLALLGAKAPRDAHLVARLRAAGAVILGKTNLSEWANIRSSRSTSGWSARGGFTKHAYALDRNPSGSSSGSGTAAAASLATLTVGTETDGSITSPASVQNLVGLKPTVGLVSRDGIVPISHTQDTAGPMVRSVHDCAVLLAALAGHDPRDAATKPLAGRAPVDYLAALQGERGVKGARIGVARSFFTHHDRIDPVIEEAIGTLRALGAVIVDPVELPSAERYGEAEFEVLLTECKHGLNAWLAEFGRGAPVKTLAEVIAFNRREAAQEMAYFGQELFEQAQAKGGLGSAAYRKALATCRREGRASLARVIARHRLDAIVAPTGGLAWLTDTVNGDHYGNASFTAPAAVAGFPHLTVPAGWALGLPVGLSFVGKAWSEATLLRIGHGFEQATRQRRAPKFLTSVGQPLR
ncbi:amidase [Caldimonas sp. KR1-144]|uniref:amidase n=1 Tax=Caldimonas sp. KR1-144 TaxID=3400911 RepID=UPI003C07CCC0